MRLAEFTDIDALGLAKLVRRGEVTPQELAILALEGIEKLNPQLNFVVEAFPSRTATLNENVAGGPLMGVPFLGKDLPFEKGVRAEMGSALAEGFVSPFDTELAVRLRRAGAVNLGRSTTSEFALAAATETKVQGRTGNPWDPVRSVAGSSGGAAVAVATGTVPFAQGSDAGGSIRMPSAFCGLVGLKPTRARVPLAPVSAMAYAGLNNVFVLTRTVRDCAAILDAVHGPAVGDGIQLPSPERPYLDEIEQAPSQLRVAFTVQSWSGLPIDRELIDAVENAAASCEGLGHAVEEASPKFDYQIYLDAQKVLWSAFTQYDIDSVASAVGRRPGRDNLQATTWDLYRKGQLVSAGGLLQALDTYATTVRRIGEFFEIYDILITPTCTITARPLGTFDPDAEGIDLFDQLAPHETFTSLFNATGQPAISLPLSVTEQGLPMGIQFAARFGDEARLLRLSAQLEQAIRWGRRRPQIHVAAAGL